MMQSSGQQQIRFCASRDGTRIAYATYGAGPPLVWASHWIHHLNLDWDSPIWRPWLSLLTRHYTVVRYDYRGCGLSDRQGISFSLEKHVEDLEAVAESAGLQSFTLVAQAGGGLVSLIYVAKHPHKVDRLALYGCQARGRSVRGMPLEAAKESEALLKLTEFGWRNEGPAYGQFFVTLHMPDASADQIRSACDLLRLTTSPENALEILRNFFNADVSELVSKIKVDTLVLHAREDPIIPFNEGRTLASLIPNAQFVPLESRNHILQENEPAWRSLVSALTQFLSIPEEGHTGTADKVGNELTPRERQVLELVAQGHDNATIGLRLGISGRTARNHVSIIFSKLDVNTRAQAIVRARDAGFGRKSAATAPGRSDG
jgi:pimeloyl-ACP methyl ester carboxylesterase/DNA-binding CsgD family transcriptional regulator